MCEKNKIMKESEVFFCPPHASQRNYRKCVEQIQQINWNEWEKKPHSLSNHKNYNRD